MTRLLAVRRPRIERFGKYADKIRLARRRRKRVFCGAERGIPRLPGRGKLGASTTAVVSRVRELLAWCASHRERDGTAFSRIRI